MYVGIYIYYTLYNIHNISVMRGRANILYEIKFIKWIKHYNNNSLHKRGRSMPAIYIS